MKKSTLNQLELIKSSRPIMPHQFSNHSIEDDHINLILEAVNWAPTHKKTVPWRYKVPKMDTKIISENFQGENIKKLPQTFHNLNPIN